MMLERFEPDYPKGLPRDGAAEPKVRAFFAPAATSRATFHNEQRLDEAGLRGRFTSSSFAPTRGSPLYEPMMSALTTVFAAHARQGWVVLEYETVLWYGSPLL